MPIQFSNNPLPTPRWTRPWMEKRLALESFRQTTPSKRKFFRWYNGIPYRLFNAVTRLIPGLYKRGLHNTLQIELNHAEFELMNWPKDLEPLNILHLSDLHLSMDSAFTEAIAKSIITLKEPYDLVVLTGDFMEARHYNLEALKKEFERLLPLLKAPAFAVPGNHDTLEVVDVLENMKVRCLVNERVEVLWNGFPIIIGGIDDAYYFKTHDLPAVEAGLTREFPALLLSHSPQILTEMHSSPYQIVLSGHTHGGQICLPSGKAILPMSYIPKSVFSGVWKTSEVQGYTSRGAGSCNLPLRFNCSPEITLIKVGPTLH